MAVDESERAVAESDAEEVVVVRHRRRMGRIVSRILVGLLILSGLMIAAAWLERKPIATDILARQMQKRGVRASYHLDKIGLRTQEISNLVIGDLRRPDLTAERVRVQMRIRLNGTVRVYRIVARGVRLNGKLVAGNRVSWGDLDKLLPAPSTSKKPFAFPDIAVDVADTSVSLQTPYGPLGIAVAGTGNLTGGFKGRLAAASSRIAPGACELVGMHANVAVSIDARRPRIVGPLAADRFACPKSRLALQQPLFDVDARFSEGFGSYTGQGRMQVASLVTGVNGLADIAGKLSFDGSPAATRGAIDLNARRARMASIVADSTRLKGRYFLSANEGRAVLVADYGATGTSLDPAVVRSLTGALDAAKGTPVGPIATNIAGAFSRTFQRFDANGSLRLVNMPGGGAVRIETANANSPAGAHIGVSGGDGVTYYWPSSRIRIDGDVATSGGGLPTARLTVRQPRGGGPLSGVLEMQPYAVAGSRLALEPVRFGPGPGNSTDLATVVTLDGPLGSGGRIEGLRVPVAGTFNPGGGFAFGRGCVTASFRLVQTGSIRLENAALPLCATGPALVWKAPGGTTHVAAQTRNLRLAGHIGSSPALITAATARYAEGNRFALEQAAIRLGNPQAPVQLAADRLQGQFAGPVISGTYQNGRGIIGKVPLLISKSDAAFRFGNSTLSVDGGLTVSDRDPAPRFFPLDSNDFHLTLGGDLIRAAGSLRHPGTGVRVTDVRIEHHLAAGSGQALLEVPGLTFGNQLQPDQLTRLTEGVIALVNGTLRGEGRIRWAGEQVTSTGDFSTAGMDLAAPFGPVSGLTGTVHFDDLLGLHTPPGQKVHVASINPGIEVLDGDISFQLLRDQLVRVERGTWPFMGGRLNLRETVLNFGRPTAKRLTFEVVGLDANRFVQSFNYQGIGATGRFDGVLPMIFDENGGRIVGGRLDSRSPGGSLSFAGAVNRANLGFVAKFAFDALKDINYRSMIIRLDGDLAGEFATRLTIDQVSLGTSGSANLLRSFTRKLPLKFNVTIKGPFRALIATAKSLRDPRSVIGDALPRPLDQVPGIATDVRNITEQKQQTQTPPATTQVTVTPTPNDNGTQR
ncbi:hypothetical protein HMF7854_14370 [Sphingomonas ginkgonis]|uniref:Uncharacterized protein n=1 Tax=Sphingomonas ginkgonis TaxID=2315330 RepID=A0A3R9WQH6_9SPHN|nr:YdbH domain-containing protein [Sphingomonas ginkgonis]RST31892.1 hypothetical protein HMF7854_14370 [Sphingomonas ginkgonis]